ncbi:hypothetical protein F4861DRAFT_503087 [Xylaria intraflava]|nr:hypothetical protein F4861DRAFT_503087 [Xylaria intraflava]
MTESKKKGFWSTLFRARGDARSSSKPELELRRASDGDLLSRRRGADRTDITRTRTRRRPRRPDPRDSKGKGREQLNGDFYEQIPLTRWPPSGISMDGDLTLGQAMELISRGVPTHKGHKKQITHASDHYYALYTTTTGNHGEGGDAVNQHDAMTQLMSLRVQGSGPAVYPWETLEQPSVAFGVGIRPGTVTLNSWVGRFSVLPPAIALRDPGVVPREIDLTQIFDRLKDLEIGLEDDDPEHMYQHLYKRLLRDPEKGSSPHKRMEQQITDLVMCLSGLDWIDFTNPKNQVVTKFIYDTSAANHGQYVKFFHQLLLSLELDLRINSRLHTEWAKERLLTQIPPKIQWDLALAKRWRDNVRVEEWGASAEQVRLRFKLRRRQTKMLKRFAQMMKWPNLPEALALLRDRDAEGSLLGVSSHAMAFFSGLVLPGPTFPFLIMNSLIDIDPDKETDQLALLTHLHPNCGFQYRNSYTYWTATSIVGKVLAPTCLEVAGWVGPARPSNDLAPSQIARVRARKPRQRMTPEDVATMGERCDPLGPAARTYPVCEYELLRPDTDDVADVRVEALGLKPLPEAGCFDASVQFAIAGVSWPLLLNFDVCFIHAWPCAGGPHPLFFDYVRSVVSVGEVVGIADWGRPGGSLVGNGSGAPQSLVKRGDADADGDAEGDAEDAERVLVVKAFGARDNEVLARAWCSHWGLSAVVADIGRTCLACAIREAYAATLTVVILVEEPGDGVD